MGSHLNIINEIQITNLFINEGFFDFVNNNYNEEEKCAIKQFWFKTYCWRKEEKDNKTLFLLNVEMLFQLIYEIIAYLVSYLVMD